MTWVSKTELHKGLSDELAGEREWVRGAWMGGLGDRRRAIGGRGSGSAERIEWQGSKHRLMSLLVSL